MCDSGMKQLSDSLLIQSYHKAIELNLSEEFVEQISREIKKRAIQNQLEKTVPRVG